MLIGMSVGDDSRVSTSGLVDVFVVGDDDDDDDDDDDVCWDGMLGRVTYTHRDGFTVGHHSRGGEY